MALTTHLRTTQITPTYSTGAYAGRPRNKGDYAIFATVRGSYGETSHHMIGGQFKAVQRCADRAVEMYVHESAKYRNVEIVNLRSGKRASIRELMEVVL